MVNNDLAMRFTENYYATKNEVSKELKISVIDGVWDKILSYRSSFYRYLPLKGIDKNSLRICLCPTISNKEMNVESRLMKLLNEFNKLDKVNGDADYFVLQNKIKCLQNVAAKKSLIFNDDSIREIIHGSKSNIDLANYYEALKYVESHFSNSLDIDYLAVLYSCVTGNDELTYFYRDFELNEPSYSVVSRVYKSAPVTLINSMMDALFNFVNSSDLTPVNKALVAFYYIEFVKPFKDFNDEIAVLFAKSVLAHERYNSFAATLPLESLLNDNSNEVSKKFYEVQITSDATYYLAFALDSVAHLVDKLLDSLVEYNTQIIKNDFYQADEPVKKEPETIELFPVEEEKPAPVVKEEVKPEPAPTPVKREEPVVEKVVIKNEPAGLAVSYIPPELDEKTASRLEKHLLELDVRLKKGQAYFYARHCTLGMYYTIEQYKKAVKCVYETARTSMEKLVEYGYYKKLEAGKKFVYTPVDRK